MSLCPYCYRTIGTFSHDPIFLPNGAKYDWDSGVPNTLVAMDLGGRWYQGFQQVSEVDIIELQTMLQQLEVDNLPEIERTEFSPVNDSGKFQVKGRHIKEMRESVEKLLIALGLTKSDYFNYDEEGNHIIHPLGDKVEWTDPVENEEDWDKFQVKAIHIEDLRHNLQLIMFRENWETAEIFSEDVGLWTFLRDVNGQDQKIWLMESNSLYHGCGLGSYFSITSGKFIKIYGKTQSTEELEYGYPTMMCHYTSPDTKYKIKEGDKLYFNILEIISDSPRTGQYDTFEFFIQLKSYLDGHIFNLSYFFTHYAGSYEDDWSIDKGELGAGEQIFDLYDDYVYKHSTLPHPWFAIFKSYYDGTIDTEGCYLYHFSLRLGLQPSLPAGITRTISVDNIRIAQ